MSEPKKKIFCFNNGGSPGWLDAVAIAEDGNIVAGHICSAEGFMKHDLGFTSNWKHENYDAHYGTEGWELEWVETGTLDSHAGLQEALRLNKLLAEKEGEVPAEK